MVVHIADVLVGDFRDVDEPGACSFDLDESAEIRDPHYGAFHHRSYGQCHLAPDASFCHA